MPHMYWCGKPCGDCANPCALDESMPCGPDCENLLPEGGRNIRGCAKTDCDAYEKVADTIPVSIDMGPLRMVAHIDKEGPNETMSVLAEEKSTGLAHQDIVRVEPAPDADSNRIPGTVICYVYADPEDTDFTHRFEIKLRRD